MNALMLLHQDAQAETKSRTKLTGGRETAQCLGAILGLGGGLTAAVLGSLLIAAGWLASEASVKHWLATAGAALLCSTIPLLILGACCLDLLEKETRPGWSRADQDDDDEDEL